MKDVASSDMRRGAASTLGSGDFRMGQPRQSHVWRSRTEYIGAMRRTEGSEPSQYLEEEKSNEIPSVAASERGRAQTGKLRLSGVVGPAHME